MATRMGDALMTGAVTISMCVPGRFVRLRAWRHEGPIGGVTGVYALGEEGELAREPVQRREGAV